MISYALITKEKLSHSIPCLNSIYKLPQHHHEILVYCPASSIQDDLDEQTIQINNLTIIEETEAKGSPSAFNNVINYASGKYISYLLNNIVYPTNLLDVVDFLENGDFRHKKVKLVNLMWAGGPGVVNNYHLDKSVNGLLWEHDRRSTPIPPEFGPYPVIPLPFVELDTIDKYLDGKIFHPAFRNHYPDHWLGFYISRIEEYKPLEWNCPTIQYGQSGYRRVSSTGTDFEDAITLRKLADRFMASLVDFKYTVEI